MTKETLAVQLDGREYRSEITDGESIFAKAAGLIVIFGYSDDNVEIRGAFEDEAGCYNGGYLYLHRGGVLDAEGTDCERCMQRIIEEKKKCALINVLWNKEPGYSWTYKTDLPHATFEIVEDGEKYCRGLVIELAALPEL